MRAWPVQGRKPHPLHPPAGRLPADVSEQVVIGLRKVVHLFSQLQSPLGEKDKLGFQTPATGKMGFWGERAPLELPARRRWPPGAGMRAEHLRGHGGMSLAQLTYHGTNICQITPLVSYTALQGPSTCRTPGGGDTRPPASAPTVLGAVCLEFFREEGRAEMQKRFP